MPAPGTIPTQTALRWALSLTVAAGCLLPLARVQAGPSAANPGEVTAAINQGVERKWMEGKVNPSPPCDDRAFARRLYLDLAGRIPTPAETDSFVSEVATDKRAALVDRLLASPEYARHMRDIFDVVFMGRTSGPGRRRRGGGEVQNFRSEWLAYLERSFAEGRPWNQTMSEMLMARPKTPAERGAVWFLYARQEKYQEIAEAVSPAVFGVQIQCAQCHDHPISHEIKQGHYWGLVAFFNRGKNKNTKDGPRIAEAATGGFSSFANLTGESSPALLSFLGAPEVPETRPAEGMKEQDAPELYLPAAADSEEPPVPKFSRREQFVTQVVQKSPLVARAAVNRFWALLLGRGIVHPVDKMDAKHPPSHPELLDWLAADFERSGYDVKRLVRAIVLSRPYQLDSRPAGSSQPEQFAYGLEKPLTGEMLYRSLLVAATGKTDTETAGLKEELVDAFPDVFPEESISTLRQTMLLTNNALILGLTKPQPGSTVERLNTFADPTARVREAYRIAYAREPDPEELQASLAYLTARPDRLPQATSQLWWALLASAEFRFNH